MLLANFTLHFFLSWVDSHIFFLTAKGNQMRPFFSNYDIENESDGDECYNTDQNPDHSG